MPAGSERSVAPAAGSRRSWPPRKLTGRPIAVNLVLPLLRPGDVQEAAEADGIVTFWGEPRRLAGGAWVHQCGSVQEAQAAEAAGADAVIAQGVEAGGHVRGTTPLLDLIERVRAAVKVPALMASRDTTAPAPVEPDTAA